MRDSFYFCTFFFSEKHDPKLESLTFNELVIDLLLCLILFNESIMIVFKFPYQVEGLVRLKTSFSEGVFSVFWMD